MWRSRLTQVWGRRQQRLTKRDRLGVAVAPHSKPGSRQQPFIKRDRVAAQALIMGIVGGQVARLLPWGIALGCASTADQPRCHPRQLGHAIQIPRATTGIYHYVGARSRNVIPGP